MRSSVSGVSVRRSDPEDVRVFSTLVNVSGGTALFRATFGQFNFSLMVESNLLSLLAQVEEVEGGGGSSNSECLGFLSLNDSPSLTKEGDAFEAHLAVLQNYLPGVRESNTLFINFLILDERPTYDIDAVGTDLIRNAFAQCNQVDYFVWLCPRAVRLSMWMEEAFSEVDLEAHASSSASAAEEEEKGREEQQQKQQQEQMQADPDSLLKGYKLLYLKRSNFLPKLLVRPARVEDNDDLLPVLRRSNPAVVEGQDDFFLADLIQAQDERNRFFVGVNKNTPVGMLATSLDVNVSLITKIFDIEAFPDLIFAKEKRPHPAPLVIGVTGDLRAINERAMAAIASATGCLFVDAEVLSNLPVQEEKDISERSDEDDNRYAMLVVDVFREYIAGLVATSTDEAPIPAILITGFPRTDAESNVIAQGMMSFDMILELKNSAEGEEVDEDDAFIHSHLDATEALFSFFKLAGNDKALSSWQRISLGASSDPCEVDFSNALIGVLEARARDIEAMKILDAEQPPKANAFAITVFCLSQEFESRGDDLLRMAFEEHPSLAYCMFMVSNSAAPTTLTSSMIATKLRTGVSFDQTLFVMHKEALLAHELIKVQRLLQDNVPHLEEFLSPLVPMERDAILAACLNGVRNNDVDVKDNPPEICFSITMENDIVGVIALSRKILGNDDITWLRCNYEIDENLVNFERYRARNQAVVTQFLISPVFSKWTRFIFREVMRKYLKTLLFHQNARDTTPPAELMDEMLPAPPRKRIQPAPKTSVPYIDRPTSDAPANDCPLFFITKRLLSQPKITVSKRIVIIGGGSSSFAILEKLCFSPHLNFPNISLIMDLPPASFHIKGAREVMDGVSGEEMSRFCDYEAYMGCLSIQDADDMTQQELYASGFAHRTTLVRGRLTDIDRENKAIVISDEVVTEYDLLIIASGTKDTSSKKFPATAGLHPVHCAARGIFGLGDAFADDSALRWVKKQDKAKAAVVVYGSGLAVLGVVGSLLNQGIVTRRITVVISDESIPEIAHPFMNEAIIRSLRSAGVMVHRGFDMLDVGVVSSGVHSVTIRKIGTAPIKGEGSTTRSESDENAEEVAKPAAEVVTLPCFSLLCCGARNCDTDVFAAVNDCGIVYDGGVVVDENFCTVDASIYAVGAFTRFSRAYADEPLHKRHNARELGLYLATQVLQRHLDPLSSLATFGANDSFAPKQPFYATGGGVVNKSLLPKFIFPKTYSMLLPGDRTFFHSELINKSEDVSVLLTGDLTADRMCAVKVDSLGMIVEIAFVGKGEVEAKNLGKLVGWHETFLNSALHAYDQGLIEDWITFFRDGWANAVYHDKFAAFVDGVRLALSTDMGTFTIIDRALDAADASLEDTGILTERKKSVGPRGEFLNEVTSKLIETGTIDFLKANKAEFQMRFLIPTAAAKPSKQDKK